MQLSTILVACAAAFATAAPAPAAQYEKKYSQFLVTDFSYGCTNGCYWSFNVGVDRRHRNHPKVFEPVQCIGGTDMDTDYIPCGDLSREQKMSAYIDKATNELRLRYSYVNAKKSVTYTYYGETPVYAATGPDAQKQKKQFTVPETRVVMES